MITIAEFLSRCNGGGILVSIYSETEGDFIAEFSIERMPPNHFADKAMKYWDIFTVQDDNGLNRLNLEITVG